MPCAWRSTRIALPWPGAQAVPVAEPLEQPSAPDVPAVPAVHAVEAAEVADAVASADVSLAAPASVPEVALVLDLAAEPEPQPEPAPVQEPAPEPAAIAEAAAQEELPAQPLADALPTLEEAVEAASDTAAAAAPRVDFESTQMFELPDIEPAPEPVPEPAAPVDARVDFESTQMFELPEPVDAARPEFAATQTFDVGALAPPAAPLAVTLDFDDIDFGDLVPVGPALAGEPEATPADVPELLADAAPQALPPEPAVEPPAAQVEPEAPPVVAGDEGDEQIKVIGDLRIGIPLYNVYLNEADEWSRHLLTELSEWALELDQPSARFDRRAGAFAGGQLGHRGIHGLSEIARALEHALAACAAAWPVACRSMRACSTWPPRTSAACCTSLRPASSSSRILRSARRCRKSWRPSSPRSEEELAEALSFDDSGDDPA
jgi:chemosensory pili system protein ChpA (sensor histidine kinase/response regulator)